MLRLVILELWIFLLRCILTNFSAAHCCLLQVVSSPFPAGVGKLSALDELPPPESYASQLTFQVRRSGPRRPVPGSGFHRHESFVPQPGAVNGLFAAVSSPLPRHPPVTIVYPTVVPIAVSCFLHLPFFCMLP